MIQMFVYRASMRSITRALSSSILLATTAGCASWFRKGEPPEVFVTKVTPLESTPFEQRLKVDCPFRNPNDYDLQITGLDFRLELEALVSVETRTSTLDVVRQVLGLRKTPELVYGIAGVCTSRMADSRSRTPESSSRRVSAPAF
jgi:hypothetical protein